jgi:hypothetical protein
MAFECGRLRLAGEGEKGAKHAKIAKIAKG